MNTRCSASRRSTTAAAASVASRAAWMRSSSARIPTAAAPPPRRRARPQPGPPPPPPPPPTPEQERYLLGLRSANRGIAQLKDGVDRVIRTQTSQDTVRQRRAGQRLAGLCGAARSFLVSGRSSMRPTVYDPPTRDVAHRLSLQVDTLIAYIPSCETVARATPKKAAQELAGRVTAFEGALKDFRVAIGVLKPTDSSKTPTR